MIEVMGTLASGPPAGATPAEAEIFWMKAGQRTVYRYASWEELGFELRTRVLLTEAAHALQTSGAQFAVFQDSRCNPRYWRRDEKGGFRLLENVTPAAGIRNIFQEGFLYAFECATAIVIVLYKGMLDSLGDGLFNLWFGGLLLYDWHYDEDLRLVDSKKPEDAVPGDVQYFKNPDFSPDHPEWQGENVLLLLDGRYYGHGIGIRSGGEIIQALNRKRRPFSQASAYLMDLVVHPDYQKLYRTIIGGSGWNQPVQANRVRARIGRDAFR
ncbi:protein-glutamine gamma-glutamyltransferase [Paenibacillus sp. YN15]|uniref:protein-glutamine gamma-glutamyltransferase n=1 Tax=Paenibacillus sp. YN15 TaxID=1742774 RepID=UPI000DCB312A|nr:protein-glutamine gamma-glutamyltransferase [Paenibacillus sp. YN15]RAU91410.1 protein-glutamine gamma-glutamyltransferase [Paenibacillus sp. YN15]